MCLLYTDKVARIKVPYSFYGQFKELVGSSTVVANGSTNLLPPSEARYSGIGIKDYIKIFNVSTYG